ncbi:MAG: hypothetical protein E3J52_03185 [Promethearchaeota archaeon]|nr:MAG: hypothetical protein E3J52_03185 [Candidatus Lokiarchaeota archaeon]
MNIDIELLKKFEDTIDIINPENGEIPIKILGFGEISVVIEIIGDPENLVYKRMPIFKNEKQVKKHEFVVKKYCDLLQNRLNINIPENDTVWFKDEKGQITFYGVQKKLIPESMGNNIIHQVSDEEIVTLVLLAMREMKKVWTLNRENENLKLGLDAQISNFAVIDYDPKNPKVTPDSKLIYVDTMTPFIRINGKEALELKLVVSSVPKILRAPLFYIFGPGIINGYYDWRTTSMDLIANFFKEQREDIIPLLIKEINNFFKEEASEFNIEPFTLEEIKKYYKLDKIIWELLQTFRRWDRFFKVKLLRKDYPFYIPNKIKR